MEYRRLTLQNAWITITILFIATICMTFTIFFAYNNSLETPRVPALIAKTPERSILILNLASQLTLFSLAELTYAVLDATRWALACSTSGVSALTFLTLSRTTSLIGAMYLAVGGNSGHAHRLWGGQRIFFTLLRMALGVILLSNVSFKPTYHGIYEIPVLQAGLSPMNTTIVSTVNFKATATDTFWWYFPSILADGRVSKNVAPLTCSGEFCTSYFMPGPLSIVQFNPNSSIVTSSDYPTATTCIQQDAPGYQIDFYPISEDEPPFTSDDCQVYGIPITAIQFCLKKTNTSFLTGWSSCPPTLQRTQACLNTTNWGPRTLSNTSMTIFQRRASTVYSRLNYTITDFTSFSDPSPMDYEPEDFFGFYSSIFAINMNQTGWPSSTQYSFLLTISSFLQSSQDNQIESGATPRLLKLQAFLATPLIIFNDAWLGRQTNDMGTSISLATSSYRLIISSASLYIFMVGGSLSLIWCYIALGMAMTAGTPGTSMFPEVDFAAKVASASTSIYSLPYLLSLLSNAGSSEIRKALAPARFYVHVVDSEKRGSVALEQGPGSRLSYAV